MNLLENVMQYKKLLIGHIETAVARMLEQPKSMMETLMN
jgi:hypothetical protein